MTALPALHIYCTDDQAAGRFSRHLTGLGYNTHTVDGPEISLPTDDLRNVYEICEQARAGQWAAQTETVRAAAEFLDALLESKRDRTGEFLIWSHGHGAWWRRARHGYTAHLDQAGTYAEDDAHEICETAAYRWRRGADGPLPPEVAIPYTDDPQRAAVEIEKATDAAIAARDGAAARP